MNHEPRLRTKRGFISERSEATKSLSTAKDFISVFSRKHSPRRGFTLIELLVVISIIGILATIGMASFTRAQERSRDGKREADMVAIRTALELYASEHNGSYPSSGAWSTSNGGASWLPGLRPTYMKTIPTETKHTNWPYLYANDAWSRSCTKGYIMLMHMETESGKPCSCGWYGGHWDCSENQ